MKKFLASLLAAAAFTSPVLAEDKVKSWRSFDSVGCMMLRECTEDVTAVQTWEDLGPEYIVAASELTGIIAALDKLGQAFFLLTRSTSHSGCVVCTTYEITIFSEQVLH